LSETHGSFEHARYVADTWKGDVHLQQAHEQGRQAVAKKNSLFTVWAIISRSSLAISGAPLMLLTAVLLPAPEGGFTAFNPETGSTSEGESIEEAIANLREATELYLEEFPLASVGQPLVTTFQVTEHA